MEQKTQREYWRKAQQSYRQRRSSQKLAWDRKRDRERKRENKQKKNHFSPLVNPKCMPDTASPEHGYKTPAARRKALSRIRQRMPSDPHKFAEVVDGLQKDVVGVSRQCGKKLDFSMDVCVRLRDSLNALQGKKDDRSKTKRRGIFVGCKV